MGVGLENMFVDITRQESMVGIADKTNILDVLQITVVSILLMVQTETPAAEDVVDMDVMNVTENIDNGRTTAFGIPLHGVFAFFVDQHIHVFYDEMVFENDRTGLVLPVHQGGFVEFLVVGDFGTFHGETDYIGREQVLPAVDFDTIDTKISMVLMTVKNEVGDFKSSINGFLENRYVENLADDERRGFLLNFLVE